MYQNTNKARDCPEIEAFLAGIEEEVINSDLRRKIKDNTEGTHLAPMTLYTLHNVNADGEGHTDFFHIRFEADVKKGVLEKVPDGEHNIWFSRMYLGSILPD